MGSGTWPWPPTAPGAAPWVVLGLLGAYHGVNPAMGWLFAVALGLQQRSRRAVLRALLPIAVGHEASVVLVTLLVVGAQFVAAPDVLRFVAAAALVVFGLYKFLKPRSHPRWVGMRVGLRDLAVWSFLMSSAHGAGLMLVPILMGLPGTGVTGADGHSHAGHDHGHGALELLSVAGGLTPESLVPSVLAALAHTLVMLVVMGGVALLVYEKLGVAVLRRAWVNLDSVWAAALIAAGVFTLFT